jgi:hypothetical protein
MYVRACLYVRYAYMHTSSYVFPHLSRAEITYKYEAMLYLDQNFTLFRTVHLAYL